MDSREKQQLNRVTTLVREVLGAGVVGAYLFGSAVLGGLRPESDLDLLVVSKRPTTREQKQRLVERLLAISGHRTPEGRWRRIELTIVVESEIRPWRYPPRFDFQYGDWLRSEFESGNLEPWPTKTNPDLATLITMVLLAKTPVLGPPPNEVFDPVPHDELVRAIVGEIDTLLGDLEQTRGMCSSRSRGSGAPLRPASSARKTRPQTGPSTGYPSSINPFSRVRVRSTSETRRSAGRHPASRSDLTPTTSSRRSTDSLPRSSSTCGKQPDTS